MKKTYFFPVARYIDLSPEGGYLQALSETEVYNDPTDPKVDDEGDVLTKRQGIWGWDSDK